MECEPDESNGRASSPGANQFHHFQSAGVGEITERLERMEVTGSQGALFVGQPLANGLEARAPQTAAQRGGPSESNPSEPATSSNSSTRQASQQEQQQQAHNANDPDELLRELLENPRLLEAVRALMAHVGRLTVTNADWRVFSAGEDSLRDTFEMLFQQFDPTVKFEYTKRLRRVDVQFSSVAQCEQAARQLNGLELGATRLRCWLAEARGPSEAMLSAQAMAESLARCHSAGQPMAPFWPMGQAGQATARHAQHRCLHSHQNYRQHLTGQQSRPSLFLDPAHYRPSADQEPSGPAAGLNLSPNSNPNPNQNPNGPDPNRLAVPKLTKQFLISPPASPPVDWQPSSEGSPNIDVQLLSALANLVPGQTHELHPASATQPGICVEVCEDAHFGGADGGGSDGAQLAARRRMIPRTPAPI